MKFGRRAGPRRSEATEPAASWESPLGVPAGQSSTDITKGVLSVPGVIAFLRENSRRILMLAAVIFAIGVVVLMLIPARYAATALVVVDPRNCASRPIRMCCRGSGKMPRHCRAMSRSPNPTAFSGR